jgi:hypothetical protein
MAAPLILVGQLLGTAFACGLNLYLTVAVLGLAARLDLLTGLPPGMRGLENGVVIGIAAALYLAEFIADRIPGVDHVWEAAHTIIRPVAAGLLVGLALAGTPLHIQLGAAVAAALMALAAHGTKAGLRMILTPCWIDDDGRVRPRRTLARTGASLLEDVAAVSIAVAALLFPGAAIFVLGASLLLLVLAGPRLWRAAMLGLRAVFARSRGFFGRPGWRSRAELPRGLRHAVPMEPLGRRPARAVPATVRGLPSVGAYRHGWLVFTCDGASFIYSARFRARCTELRGIRHVHIQPGVLTDTLEIHADDGSPPVTFFLLKDGPSPQLAAAELTGSYA